MIAARDLLAEKAGIAAEIYSAPSFPLLRRDALEAERWNRLHPAETPRVPYVSTVLGPDGGPIVAATDWMKALPDMVSRWLPPYYVSLGTDGFGRSDTREALRTLFEIDPPHIAAAALAELGALRGDAGRQGRRRRSRRSTSTRRSWTRPRCSRAVAGRRVARHAPERARASPDRRARRCRVRTVRRAGAPSCRLNADRPSARPLDDGRATPCADRDQASHPDQGEHRCRITI